MGRSMTLSVNRRAAMSVKSALACASLAVVLAAGAASPASALDFMFSFTNDVGNVSGTVTGEVFGLADNATSSATTVDVLTWPGALIPVANQPDYPAPVDATTWATQVFNTFTVVSGNVTSADFQAQNSTGVSTLDQLWLNSGPCSSGPTCSFLSLGSSNGQYVWHGVAGTTFSTPGGVPEPSIWAMMLLGVGLIGGGLRTARRTGGTALTAA
jgi:hypothetical protein